MVKQLLKLMICSLALLVPVTGMAFSHGTSTVNGFEVVETVKMTVTANRVRVQQGEGQILEVYSVTGAKVMSVKIESADQTIRLNLGRGCYIFKIGDVARKVSIL